MLSWVVTKTIPVPGKPKVTKNTTPPPPETLLVKLIRSGIYPSISPIKSVWVGRLERGQGKEKSHTTIY